MSREYQSLRMSQRSFISIGAVFLVASFLIVAAVNFKMRSQALVEAESKASIILDMDVAINEYFAQEMRPTLLASLKEHLAEGGFDPCWMSSTFAVNRIDERTRDLRHDAYEAQTNAINARNPENEADAFERDFIQEVNEKPDLDHWKGVRFWDGKPWFVLLRRGHVVEERCLLCHGDPVHAPPGLLAAYGTKGGFNLNVGSVVSAMSVRVPLEIPYSIADQFSRELSFLLLVLLVILFATQHLINRRSIFKPLVLLHRHALQVAESDDHLGQRIEEPAGMELKGLTQAFNTMSGNLKARNTELRDLNERLSLDVQRRIEAEKQLQAARDRLEEKVRDRTIELVQANDQLRLEIRQREKAEKALQESEQFLKIVIARVNDGVIVCDKDLRYKFWSDAMVALTGFESDEVLGKPVDIFPHVVKYGIKDLLKRALAGETVRSGDIPYCLPSKGKKGWVTGIYTPYIAPDGTITGVVAAVHEITARKDVEEKLREVALRFRSVFTAARDAIILFDHETGDILDANDSALSMYGYRREGMIGAPVSRITGQVYPQVGDCTASRLCEHPIRNHTRSDGSVFPVDISASCHMQAERRVSTLVIRDVTERKRSEDALRLSEQRLRFLSSKLLKSHEEERKRIAREVHDNIGSLLTGFKIHLENTLLSIERGGNAAPSMKMAIEISKRAIRESRRIISGLRPSVLDDYGIAAAVDWLCNYFQPIVPETRFETRVDIDESGIPESLRITLFRVLQEAMNNVVKHSRSSSLLIQLSGAGSKLELLVVDDGIGFDPAQAVAGPSDARGLGLTSMRERVELSGGAFEIHSHPGEGTTIRARWEEVPGQP